MKHKFTTLFLTILASIGLAHSAVISIDGDFNDWEALPAGSVAVAEINENSPYWDLYKLMLTQDSDYIYFYVEFSAEEGDFYIQQQDTTIHGYIVDYFDFLLDLDNDTATGMKYNWAFKDGAAEWLLEGSWRNFNEAELFPFDPNSPQDDWAFLYSGKYNGVATASDTSILANGHLAFEGKISKKMIPGNIELVKVGLITNDSGWSWSGVLPQVTCPEEGGLCYWSPILEVPYYGEACSITLQDDSTQGNSFTKFFRNGQLLINKNGKTYTIQGQEIIVL